MVRRHGWGGRPQTGLKWGPFWLALSLFLACSNSVLLGMVPPEYMEAARRRAAMHLQVEVVEVNVPEKTPCYCEVEAKVRRIFDDHLGLLEPGQTVLLDVACVRRGDEVASNRTLWTRVEDLKVARFLEVYMDLHADSHHPRIPTLNYALSRTAIENPTLDPEDRETHFVVAIDEATQESGSDEAMVKGKVLKVFRDESKLLAPGKTVRFALDCGTSDPQGGPTPPCSRIVQMTERFVEVVFYLNSPFDQVGIIDKLTSKPTCPREASGYWCGKKLR